jgi:hypothetical protein
MKSRGEIVSFGLFIVVALAAMFYVLTRHGQQNTALGLGLAAVIAIRAGMFLYNLKRQRDRIEKAKPRPEPEIKLDL